MYIKRLKIGLVSSIVTVLNLILDGISIFYVNRLVFAIIGIIVAVILVIVFSSKKLEKKIDKIKNKEYVRRIIEASVLLHFALLVNNLVLIVPPVQCKVSHFIYNCVYDSLSCLT